MTTTSAPSTSTDRYREARDLLLSLHGQPERARAEFRYPDVGETFNWAVDWFDAIARGNDRPALTIVEEDLSDTTLSYDEVATRSDQVAAFLAERVLLPHAASTTI